MRSCRSLTRGSASACTSCAVWWKVHQPNTKPSSVSTSSNFLRSCTACSWNTYSSDAWQKSRSAMSIAASACTARTTNYSRQAAGGSAGLPPCCPLPQVLTASNRKICVVTCCQGFLQKIKSGRADMVFEQPYPGQKIDSSE